MSEDEEYDGLDSAGRRKPVKRPPVKFELQPRNEGESIEDWIKRETERIVANSAECLAKKAHIKELATQKAEAGTDYGAKYSHIAHLEAEKRKAMKEVTKQHNEIIRKYKKEVVTPAKKKKGDLERKRKAQLAKYNTLYNRYFTAVKKRVFHNMKSLCEIKHTWAEPKIKRTLQNSDAGQNRKQSSPTTIQRLKEKADAT